MIVSKFGGSSVKDASSILNCLAILKENRQRSVVIVSASGKTTNELEIIWNSKEPHSLIKDVFNKHRDLARELGIYHLCQIYMDDLETQAKECLNHRTQNHLRDQLLSFGERLSSFIFYRKAQEVLAPREVIFDHAYELIQTNSFYGEADPLQDETHRNIKKRFEKLAPEALVITQGFLGQNEEKNITTLGREGSDFSASLFASALDSEILEIWTDVDGIYDRDPHRFENAKRLDHLSYEQADTLAKSGMKVLFKRTIEPINKNRTRVFVGQTSNPQKGGTIISSEGNKELKRLGMAIKENITQINIAFNSDVSSNEHGLENIKALLDQCKIHPLFLSYKSVILENNEKISSFVSKLKEFCCPVIFTNQIMINLVGDELLCLKQPLDNVLEEYEKEGKTFEVVEYRKNFIGLITSSAKDHFDCSRLEKLFFGP